MNERTQARVRRQPSVLTESQRIGLRYYEELQLRIPRAEVQMIEARVRAVSKGGVSYSRGRGESSITPVCLSVCLSTGEL